MAFLTQGSLNLGIDTFSEIVPKRIALKYSPPTLVLEYLIPTSGKLYIHNMRLKSEEMSIPAESLYEKLKKKHIHYLDPSKISESQVIDLIKLLQQGFIEKIIL